MNCQLCSTTADKMRRRTRARIIGWRRNGLLLCHKLLQRSHLPKLICNANASKIGSLRKQATCAGRGLETGTSSAGFVPAALKVLSKVSCIGMRPVAHPVCRHVGWASSALASRAPCRRSPPWEELTLKTDQGKVLPSACRCLRLGVSSFGQALAESAWTTGPGDLRRASDNKPQRQVRSQIITGPRFTHAADGQASLAGTGSTVLASLGAAAPSLRPFGLLGCHKSSRSTYLWAYTNRSS